MNQRERLWFGRLFEDPAFMQLYADRWQTLRQSALSNASMSEVIASQVAEIGEATATAQGISPAGQWKQRLHTMETWLHDRADWLDTQFPKPPTIHIANGESVTINSAVRISATKGMVYYTTDGIDPKDGSRPSNKASVIHPPSTQPLLSMKAPSRAHAPQNAKIDRTWFALEFDDEAWPLGLTGVGYDDDRTYRRHIGTDLADELSGKHTTVCVRVPFKVKQDPKSFVSLTLHMAYDDGFVAYLNGTRVAADRASESPAWNARATSKNSDQVGHTPVMFEINEHLALLRQGTNVLAIHGLNDQLSSFDMLVAPTLSAGVPRSGQAQGPTVTEDTTVIARTFLNELWSAPTRTKIPIKR